MRKSLFPLVLFLFLVLFTSCPTEQDVIEAKRRSGIDLLEKYSTIEYYDSGKGETITVPMEFKYYVGIDSSGHHQRIKLSKQEMNSPNKQFKVTVKAKLSEGMQGFTIFILRPEASNVQFTVVGKKEEIGDEDWYWSKEEDGFAVVQFEMKPVWSNTFDLCWQTVENHYLHDASTCWYCYAEEE